MPKGVYNNVEPRGPRRTPDQRELDRVEIVRGIRRGLLKKDIAAKLGISPGQLSNDWKKILRELREERDRTAEDLMSQSLAQYAGVKEEAWKAWDQANGRFLEEVIRQVVEQLDKAKEIAKDTGQPFKMPESFEVRVKTNPPNEYLGTVAKMIDREAELHGVKEPDTVGGSNVQVNVGNFDWTMLYRRPQLTGGQRIEEELRQVKPLAAPDDPIPYGLKELPDPEPGSNP